MWENVCVKVPLDIRRIVGVVFNQGPSKVMSFVCRCAYPPVRKPSRLCSSSSNSAGPAALLHTCAQHSRTTAQLPPLRPNRVRRERHPSPDVCDGYLPGSRVAPAPACRRQSTLRGIFWKLRRSRHTSALRSNRALPCILGRRTSLIG